MAEQTIIQVSVDTDLKDQAADIYERIGIDIPTAVRMFFKATVREQDLPFSTKPSKELSQTDRFAEFIKGCMMYEPPLAGDQTTVAILPLENGCDVPAAMYVQLVSLVPAGRITRREYILAFLSSIYRKPVKFPNSVLPYVDTSNRDIPYWRIVSERGTLIGGRAGSKELQKEKLVAEGIPVVQRGSTPGSYKVENYKEYLFDFRTLNVVKEAL